MWSYVLKFIVAGMYSFFLLLLLKRMYRAKPDARVLALYFLSSSLFAGTLMGISGGGQATLLLIVNGLLLLLFILASVVLMVRQRSPRSRVRVGSRMDDMARLNERLKTELFVRKKIEEELRRHATTDIMTGAINKRKGLLLLEKHLSIAENSNGYLTVCFIDLNNLKSVNDRYGHREGDEYIITVSKILKECIRGYDVLCRLGGDEFLLIMPDCRLEKARQVVERVEIKLGEVNYGETKPYELSLSYGFAGYEPGMETTTEALLEIADIDMYKNKRRFKGKL